MHTHYTNRGGDKAGCAGDSNLRGRPGAIDPVSGETFFGLSLLILLCPGWEMLNWISKFLPLMAREIRNFTAVYFSLSFGSESIFGELFGG